MFLNYYRKAEKGGLIYTIDWFTIEVAMTLTDQQWTELEEAVKEYGAKTHDFRSWSGSKKKGRYHKFRAYAIEKLHVQFYDDAPVLQIDFNPNTVHTAERSVMLSALRYLLGYVRSCLNVRGVCVRRCDYAVDVPHAYSDLRVLSRKMEGHVRSTRYYGSPTASGRLRVYDKRQEQLDMFGLDLGRDLTRCEWIQRNEKPFTYDAIGTLGALPNGAGAMLDLVPPEFFNEALHRLSKHTRQKVVRNMHMISVDPEIFKELLQQYYDEYGIFEIRLLALQNDLARFEFDDLEGGDDSEY